MEKPLGFSDAVASGSIKRISSFFLFIWDLSLSHCYGLNREYYGSVVILGGLSLVNSLHAYTFASLKRKKLISTTPLNDALNALILALNASAAAFVLLFTKKFRILS